MHFTASAKPERADIDANIWTITIGHPSFLPDTERWVVVIVVIHLVLFLCVFTSFQVRTQTNTSAYLFRPVLDSWRDWATLQEELLSASDCFSSPFMSSSPMRLGHVLTAQAFDYMAITSTFQSALLLCYVTHLCESGLTHHSLFFFSLPVLRAGLCRQHPLWTRASLRLCRWLPSPALTCRTTTV